MKGADGGHVAFFRKLGDEPHDLLGLGAVQSGGTAGKKNDEGGVSLRLERPRDLRGEKSREGWRSHPRKLTARRQGISLTP